MDDLHNFKESDLTDLYKHLSYPSESHNNQHHAVLVDATKNRLLDNVTSLFDQVGILSPENRYRTLVLTFLQNVLDGKAGDTSIRLNPITLAILPSLRFHYDQDGDIGLHHPLTEKEIISHIYAYDFRCPMGRTPVCHYSDFVSYISTNLNVELSRNKLRYFRKQLRRLLNIPQPVHIDYPNVIRIPEDIPVDPRMFLAIVQQILRNPAPL